MTKQIPITQGKFVLVDDADYKWLSQSKWYFQHHGYATRNINGHARPMHRLIMGDPINIQVDHINGNKLDNRRENLRLCTHKENIRNQKKHKNNTSGYKGVFRRRNRWMAQIQHDRQFVYIGTFDTPQDAAQAYDEKARELFGDFAKPNGRKS
jgi:hypothetical protein